MESDHYPCQRGRNHAGLARPGQGLPASSRDHEPRRSGRGGRGRPSLGRARRIRAKTPPVRELSSLRMSLHGMFAPSVMNTNMTITSETRRHEHSHVALALRVHRKAAAVPCCQRSGPRETRPRYPPPPAVSMEKECRDPGHDCDCGRFTPDARSSSASALRPRGVADDHLPRVPHSHDSPRAAVLALAVAGVVIGGAYPLTAAPPGLRRQPP